MTASWYETSLTTILSKYDLCDTDNADEFGLFYQGLPKKTMHVKGKELFSRKTQQGKINWTNCCKCTWRKTANICNWQVKETQDALKTSTTYRVVIGPKKSWMCYLKSGSRKSIKKIQKDGRNVATIIDNCPAHPVVKSDGINKVATKHNVAYPTYGSRSFIRIHRPVP